MRFLKEDIFDGMNVDGGANLKTLVQVFVDALNKHKDGDELKSVLTKSVAKQPQKMLGEMVDYVASCPCGGAVHALAEEYMSMCDLLHQGDEGYDELLDLYEDEGLAMDTDDREILAVAEDDNGEYVFVYSDYTYMIDEITNDYSDYTMNSRWIGSTVDGDKTTIYLDKSEFYSDVATVLSGGGSDYSFVLDRLEGKDLPPFQTTYKDWLWCISRDNQSRINSLSDVSDIKKGVAELLNEQLAEDVRQYWEDAIYYKLYESGDGFEKHNVDVTFEDKHVGITFQNSELADVLNDAHENEVFFLNQALTELDGSVSEPYSGWSDEVEVDMEYYNELISDYLDEVEE